MKNKGLIIILIIILSIVIIGLIILMSSLIKTKTFFGLKLFNKVSEELVLDETYKNDFNALKIKANVANIYIKTSDKDDVHVIIYGKKDKNQVEFLNNQLIINSDIKSCIGLCFNQRLAKIEVFLPKEFDQSIKIVSNYGDIFIEEFANAHINIDEKTGNISIKEALNVELKNDYGNINIGKIKNANIKENCGEISIDEVDEIDADNDYGNIVIKRVNEYLKLENDCGNISIDELNIVKDSSIKANLGEIKINKTNEIFIDAKTDLGKTKIGNNYRTSDITLDIKNDCGNIIVN